LLTQSALDLPIAAQEDEHIDSTVPAYSRPTADRYEENTEALSGKHTNDIVATGDTDKTGEYTGHSGKTSYLETSSLAAVTISTTPSAYGYTDDFGGINDTMNAVVDSSGAYADSDLSVVIEKPGVTLGGYILDDETLDEEEKPVKKAPSLEDSGYMLYSDAGADVTNSDGYGDYADGKEDAYGVHDLSETTLEKNAYLLPDEPVKDEPKKETPFLTFSSSYESIDIEDPSIQLEAKFNTEMAELEPSDDDLRSAGLLRTSSSFSLLSSSSDRYSSGSIAYNVSKPLLATYQYDSAPNQSISSSQSASNAVSTKSPSAGAPDTATYVPYGTTPGVAGSDSYISQSQQSSLADDHGSYVTLVGRPGALPASGSLRSSLKPSIPAVLHSSQLTTPQAIQDMLDSQGSWNERFQAIFDAPDSEVKYDAMHRLSMDFLGVAETYGRVIISELSLPDEDKTIKPINIGGVAGGSKYAARGLLFKFAVDVPPHFLYGSDEYAQKAAGHELKGLNNWSLHSEGLHFPLMALVRYCGFTLVALSMLPIGKKSLVYGSDDAGRSVHFDDDALYEKMKRTAQNLNLKGHYLVADPSKMIYGPGDIEGHLGDDLLHYVLDYARVYPPAALVQGEIKEKSRCLFRLLRPELVSRFETPLSSDAFTAWGRINSDIHNAEVRKATQHLVDRVIPDLAKAILTQPAAWEGFTRLFHLHGVNVRYMGLVRRIVYGLEKATSATTPMYASPMYKWLLREMVARTIKSVLNQKWRELIKKYQRITPDRCIQEAVGVLNAFVEPQTAPASINFWNKTIRDLLNVKFPLALLEEEMELNEQTGKPKVDLQNLVLDKNKEEPWSFIFARISELTGMHFSDQVMKTNCGFPKFGMLTAGDILEINPSVKQMSLVDFAYVMSKALIGLRQSSPSLATRLIALAIARLREAPSISLVVLRRIIMLKSYIVRTLKRMKWSENMIKAVAELVDVALDGSQLMAASLPTDLATDAAVFLYEIHANNIESRKKIVGYLQRAIASDPTNVRPYIETAKIYAFSSRPQLEPQSREWIDKTIEVAPNDVLVRLQLGLLLLMLPGAFTQNYTKLKHETALDEVMSYWQVVKDADPALFRQLDLHLLSPRVETDISVTNTGTDIMATSHRLQSFSALVRVAVMLKCQELNETIKETLQEESDIFIFLAPLHCAWNSDMMELFASFGPFESFKRIYISDAESISPECSELAFGKILVQCPNLNEIHLITNLPTFKGEFLSSISRAQQVSVLELTGPAMEEAHLETFFDNALSDPQFKSLKTLLLPSSIGVACASKLLHRIADVLTLEHFRCSHWDESIPEAIVRHADSLTMLSLARAQNLVLAEIQALLPKLPKLLVFDGSGSSLTDSVIASFVSLANFHPTFEIFISASETYYLFTGSTERRIRLSGGHTKPTSFIFSIYSAEWPSLALMPYTAKREFFTGDRFGAIQLFIVGKPTIGPQPQQAFLFGKHPASILRCMSGIMATGSSLHWQLGTLKVIEIKFHNNSVSNSQMMWMHNQQMRNAVPSPVISAVTRMLLPVPGGKDTQILFHHTGGGASDITLPPGFPVNYWAIAVLSFIRQLPL